ncbi:MAG: 23S rRNA (adenine(2503)-C(2))-methyltransferase RlmN [Anaerolineae bacterium]|nr:23S rRNA (adenine(2503)-C(2))-methyltransferase RlmN [Anaerolineae bacterium]
MTAIQPISLLDLSRAELTDRLAGWGAPRYRADQIWEWIYKKLVTDPAQMTNLPKDLRERLAALGPINPLDVVVEQRSQDRQTIKWLFRLPDGVTIESVLMLYDERRTVCISTQAGCAMGCVFCATGQAGLARNLTAGEIVAQVLAAARWLATTDDARPTTPAAQRPTDVGDQQPRGDNRLTNIVVMGMGEPLANYERTWTALRTLTDPAGFGLGARHITLSTVGLPHGIRKMAEEPLQINLAVSLHAANDDLRTQLVPINHRYPIAEVMAAVRDYVGRTHRRVTFEYALMKGINDMPAHARELAALLKGLLCHVNLIPLNPVAGSPYQPSTAEAAAQFQQILEARGIAATVRLRRGLDIDAGCGQLRRRMNG